MRKRFSIGEALLYALLTLLALVTLYPFCLLYTSLRGGVPGGRPAREGRREVSSIIWFRAGFLSAL